MNFYQAIKFILKNLLYFSTNFNQVINTCFSKYIIFKGRANRAEYWYWRLFEFFVAYASFRLDQIVFEKTSGSFSLFVFLITFLPGISVSVRRLHDLDKSGWWLLLPFLGIFFFFFTKITNMSIILINMSITLSAISFLILLFWFVSPGTKGENRFD